MSTDKKTEETRLFHCEICHYNTLIESSYDKHILSAKHVMLTGKVKSKVFSCDACHYITIKKSCYDKHLESVKHKLQTRELKDDEGKLICDLCNRPYSSRPGLWAHKKRCSLENKKDEVTDVREPGVKGETAEEKHVPLENTIVFASSPPPTMVDFSTNDNQLNIDTMECQTIDDTLIPSNAFIQQIWKKTQDFQNFFIEQQQKYETSIVEQQRENKDLINKLFDMTQQNLAMTTNITNNTVNNNQRFNLNVFLNETCKDAMNLDEFLDTIRPTFDELLVMGDVGFVDGITDIFIKRLRALDITKRPIHCTDAKRETIFLKENNVWTKDDNGHSRLNSIIEKVEYRNVVCLHQWCLDNPDAMVNNHEKNLLRDKIYLQTLLGDPKTREKVVKNIAKEVALDREAIMLQFGRK